MYADEMIANLGKEKKVVSAGFFRRFAAFVLDLLLLNVIVFSAFSGILSKYFTLESLSSFKEGIPVELSLIIFLLGLLSFVYFTLLEYGAKKTPGMMIAGIKLEGNNSFWSCAARNLFIIPIFPLTLLWIIEPLHLIFRKKRLSEALTNTDTILSD
ncbi:MAG: RDD family protein [Candidatus Nanoarchaeia archaeon]